MPNARREGWRVASFSAPIELVEAAQQRAAAEGTNLSEVIRAALEDYAAGS